MSIDSECQGVPAALPSTPRRRRLTTIALAVATFAALMTAAVLGWTALAGRGRLSRREALARATEYLRRGQPSMALRAVRPILDADPNAGEALGLAGMALAILDHRSEARDALERALKRQPKQPMALKVLAAIHLSTGDYERGLARLRAAAELDPGDPRPWLAMGRAYQDLGRDPESADCYQAAYHRDRHCREARLGLVAAALRMHRTDRAAPHLIEMLRDAPEDPEALGLAACHANELGHPEQAAAFAARALGRDPDNFDALLARATSASLKGDPRGALRDLERAVEVKPISIAALRLLAQVQSRLGQAGAARQVLARARAIEESFVFFDRLTAEIARRPNDPEPRWRMGQVAAAANMPEIAVNSFQAALLLDPGCLPARTGLAALRKNNPDHPPQ